VLPAAALAGSSDSLQVRRRGLALLASLDVEADLLAFIEASQAGALDGRDMDKDILRPVVRLDEAVPLLGIEPFDRAFRHRSFLHATRRSTPRGLFKLGAPKRDEVA